MVKRTSKILTDTDSPPVPAKATFELSPDEREAIELRQLAELEARLLAKGLIKPNYPPLLAPAPASMPCLCGSRPSASTHARLYGSWPAPRPMPAGAA